MGKSCAPSPPCGRYFPTNGEELRPLSGPIPALRAVLPHEWGRVGPIPALRAVLPHEWGRVAPHPRPAGGTSPRMGKSCVPCRAPSPPCGRYFPMNGEELAPSPPCGRYFPMNGEELRPIPALRAVLPHEWGRVASLVGPHPRPAGGTSP